jgi:hypothetical protein
MKMDGSMNKLTLIFGILVLAAASLVLAPQVERVLTGEVEFGKPVLDYLKASDEGIRQEAEKLR